MRKQMMAAVLAAAAVMAGSFMAFGEENASVPVIGEDTSGQNNGFVLENATGQEIKGVAVRINYGDFSDNLLTEDVSFADGEKVQLLCTPGEMVNYVPAVYDLQVTFADDSEAVLHTVPMGDAEELTILTGTMESGEGEAVEAETEEEAAPTVYIRFTSLSLGYELDTLRKETEIGQLGEAFLKADYEASTTYTGGGETYYDGGETYSDGGGDTSGGDGCLGGGILF